MESHADDMVLRVARAIDRNAWADDKPLGEKTTWYRWQSMMQAKKAIEAMREPIEPMLAVRQELKELSVPGAGIWSVNIARETYQAMIDAALNSSDWDGQYASLLDL